uniref:Uncharacterized protein n=1 Tax=Rhizophora mucronata TaxID=61149 RepID=A0A2P2NNA6_RHIMU
MQLFFLLFLFLPEHKGKTSLTRPRYCLLEVKMLVIYILI